MLRRENRVVYRFAHAHFPRGRHNIASIGRYVYKNAAARVLRMDTMLKSMQTVKWDCKDLPEQHNPYIDALRKELEVYSIFLCYRELQVVCTNRSVFCCLWTHAWNACCS